MTNNSDNIITTEPEKKKRGRKKLSVISDTNNTPEIIDKPPPKKRGRKPKGGKIVQEVTTNKDNKPTEPNIILHLKCSISDITNTITDTFNYNPNIENVQSYAFNTNNISELQDDDNIIDNNIIDTGTGTGTGTGIGTCSGGNCSGKYNDDEMDNTIDKSCDQKEVDNSATNNINIKTIWNKLHALKLSLHNNLVTDKHSACFWCTYPFDNPPIYLPKFENDKSYHVYGCFCTPECSIGYLMNEKIDTSVKFERYQLANQLYGKIFNYKQNIKPAPSPFYILDKYYGNLNINEYRHFLSSQQLLMVVDKPVTHVFPELYEDNNEFILNQRTIPSNTNLKLTRKSNIVKKNTILDEFTQNK